MFSKECKVSDVQCHIVFHSLYNQFPLEQNVQLQFYLLFVLQQHLHEA